MIKRSDCGHWAAARIGLASQATEAQAARGSVPPAGHCSPSGPSGSPSLGSLDLRPPKHHGSRPRTKSPGSGLQAPVTPFAGEAWRCTQRRAGAGTRASGTTYLMHLIHSSFSSGVGAEIRYTVWFPSTTRPSASVLQALITWSLLSGM